MASPSTEIDSEATISDTHSGRSVNENRLVRFFSSPDNSVHEIPPQIIDAEDEEVAMEQRNQEVDVSELLKDIHGIHLQDWRAFAQKRINDGRIDKTYIHKKYFRKFRSKREVEQFVRENGIETGMFGKSKLRKKKTAGMDAQDAGTSKSAGRRVSANHARPKHSLGQRRSINEEEFPPAL